MKVWRIKADLSEVNKSYQLKNYMDKPFFRDFSDKNSEGETFNGKYDNVEIFSTGGMKVRDFAHCWAGEGLIVTNEKTKACLEELLDGFVEFVPLKCGDATFYLMNVVTIIDAVDNENAVLGKSATGRTVEKFSFIPEKIQGIPIFKTTIRNRTRVTEIFVSTEFKEYVEKNLFTGVTFTEVKEVERVCL